jgi:hypothetical protein
VGEVNGGTGGSSAGTQATDRAAFDSLGPSLSSGDVSCTYIPASDTIVAAVADGVESGQVDYSLVPEFMGGANSNSAAAAVATRAASTTGSTPDQPGLRISFGTDQEAVSTIPFKPGTPGNDIPPPELPGTTL